MARWTRSELLQALNLYHRTPFGRQHKGNPEIISLAKKLDRTPSALAMKLSNFTSLDVEEQKRGISGLSGASVLDKSIWSEFENNMPALAEESEPLIEIESFVPVGNTEATSSVKMRRYQSFFRRTVLGSYDLVCCISGNPVPELLRASHIIPWSQSEKHRLNPRNGLCLSATFDAAFDRGLIAFDQNLCLLLSNRLKNHLPNLEIERIFLEREGRKMRLPLKNLPDVELLGWHRKYLFR